MTFNHIRKFMKHYLAFTLLITLPLHAETPQQPSDINQTLTQSIDILVGAYNGAEEAIAKNSGRTAQRIDPNDVTQLKNQTTDTINKLQHIGEQLQQGNFQHAAANIDQLQNQFDKKGELPRIGDYVRQGANLYHHLTKQYSPEQLQNLTPTQAISLFATLTSNLQQDPKTAAINNVLASISQMLIQFEQLIQTSEPYQQEHKTLHQDIQYLKTLAHQQGIPDADDPVDNLLTNLKLAVAENSIGQLSNNRSSALKTQLQQYINYPRAIFSHREYQEAYQLLLQLGVAFSPQTQQWTKLEKLLIRKH